MASTVEFRSIAKVVALVTGGASGLGRATAARLAAQVRNNNIIIITSESCDPRGLMA